MNVNCFFGPWGNVINVIIVFSTIKAIKFVDTFTILSKRITIIGSLIFISSTRLLIASSQTKDVGAIA
jgi:hypothetical protein